VKKRRKLGIAGVQSKERFWLCSAFLNRRSENVSVCSGI